MHFPLRDCHQKRDGVTAHLRQSSRVKQRFSIFKLAIAPTTASCRALLIAGKTQLPDELLGTEDSYGVLSGHAGSQGRQEDRRTRKRADASLSFAFQQWDCVMRGSHLALSRHGKADG